MLLSYENVRKWRQRERLYIKPEHVELRLARAMRYRHFASENWPHVRWSDECSVEGGSGLRLTWTFNRPTKKLIDQYKSGLD